MVKGLILGILLGDIAHRWRRLLLLCERTRTRGRNGSADAL